MDPIRKMAIGAYSDAKSNILFKVSNMMVKVKDKYNNYKNRNSSSTGGGNQNNQNNYPQENQYEQGQKQDYITNNKNENFA